MIYNITADNSRTVAYEIQQQGLALIAKRDQQIQDYHDSYGVFKYNVDHINDISEDAYHREVEGRAASLNALYGQIQSTNTEIGKLAQDFQTYGTTYQEGAPVNPEIDPIAGMYSQSDLPPPAPEKQNSNSFWLVLGALALYYVWRLS